MNRPLARLALSLVLAIMLVPTAWSDEPPASISRRELDSRIDEAAYRAVVAGLPLYDQRDFAGCYRLFQGTLISVDSMLEDRPEIRKVIEKGLKDAEGAKSDAQKAIELRRTLDVVLAGIRGAVPLTTSAPAPAPAPEPRPAPAPAPAPAPIQAARPLWDRLGGEPVVRSLVRDLVAQSAKDRSVDLTRGGKVKLDAPARTRLESHLVEWISAQGGGPIKYKGRDLRSAHAGMGIGDDQLDAMLADLGESLKQNGVAPRDGDELLALFRKARKEIVEKPRASAE